MDITFQQVSETLQAPIVAGDPSLRLVGVTHTTEPKPCHVTLCFSEAVVAQLDALARGMVVVSTIDLPASLPHIRVKQGKKALAALLHLFYLDRSRPMADLPTVIHPTVDVADQTSIGSGCAIDEKTVIHPGVRIGKNCVIGKHCRVFDNVVLYDGVCLGDHVTIHSGSIIGAEGFNYYTEDGRHYLVPHIGSVWIGDHVDIGALTTIDRGVLKDTVIGPGTKIDNHCHIAHNTVIGSHGLMAGASNVSGSVTIGNHVIIAGAVNIRDNVTIGDNSVILGRSGVTKSFPEGSSLSGFPAQLHQDELKEKATLKRLIKNRLTLHKKDR